MRKAELTVSPVVYLIIALIVLVVCIALFFGLTNTPLKSIFGFGSAASNQSAIQLDEIKIRIGSCNSGDTGCLLGKKYYCKENKWVGSDNDC